MSGGYVAHFCQLFNAYLLGGIVIVNIFNSFLYAAIVFGSVFRNILFYVKMSQYIVNKTFGFQLVAKGFCPVFLLTTFKQFDVFVRRRRSVEIVYVQVVCGQIYAVVQYAYML